MKREIRLLKKWVEKNSAPYLAYKLGYKDCGTIKAWIDRGSIPHYQIEKIRAIIEKGDLDERVSSAG